MSRVLVALAVVLLLLTGCATETHYAGFWWTAPIHAPCASVRWVQVAPGNQLMPVGLRAYVIRSDSGCVVLSTVSEDTARQTASHGISLWDHEMIHAREGRDHPTWHTGERR